MRTAGGLAALAAALLWAIKSASILLTGYQPPVVFEGAPALFGVTVVALASGYDLRRARGAQVLGGLGSLAGLLAAWSELTGEVWGPALASAMVSVILGQILIGLVARHATGPVGKAGRLVLLIGLATTPAMLVGGLLALINERLLEVPVLLLACAWAWLGVDAAYLTPPLRQGLRTHSCSAQVKASADVLPGCAELGYLRTV